MEKTYEIYVADDNGWFEGCPSYRDVFFCDFDSYEAECSSRGGCLVIKGHGEAKAVLATLSTTGDWSGEDGTSIRPAYAMRERIVEVSHA